MSLECKAAADRGAPLWMRRYLQSEEADGNDGGGWFIHAKKWRNDEKRFAGFFCSTTSSGGSFSSVVEQVLGKVAPSVNVAMAKLRAVANEPWQQDLGKRLVMFLVPPSGGAVAFGATLMAAQAAGAAAGVSCASPLVASLMGCISICSASAASAQVSHTLRRFCEPKPSTHQDPFLFKDDFYMAAFFGVILYKALGGNYRNLMPSNVASPGALARASIPARGRKYANKVEQGLIQDLYRKHGCHHCGQRAGSSIADHMPPNVIAHGRGWAKPRTPNQMSSFLARLASSIPLPAMSPRVVQQRFYPQCTNCTNVQSTALRHGKKALVLHFRRGIPEAPYFAGFCIGAIPLESLNTTANKKS